MAEPVLFGADRPGENYLGMWKHSRSKSPLGAFRMHLIIMRA